MPKNSDKEILEMKRLSYSLLGGHLGGNFTVPECDASELV
jgi:hypothetical protein